MSNDLKMFEGSQVPAHISNMFGDEESNIDSGSKINSLSVKGKVFRIQYDGDEVPLMRYNEETGDNEPMSAINLIVINQGPFGARDYFEDDYNSAQGVAPTCFSVDGKVPHPSSTKIQSETCATCPHAVKGSKLTQEGHPTTACALKRRLVVVPAHKPDFAGLLLKLASTSAYDPDTKNAENGWFGWRQYMDFLNARGVRHTAQLVTKVRFDPNAEYPKLLFKPERFLNEDEAKIVGPRIKDEEVMGLIYPPETNAPAGAPAATADDAEDAARAAAGDPDPAPSKAPAQEAEEEASEQEMAAAAGQEAEEEAPAPSKVTKKKKVSKKKAAKKADEESEDDGIERTPAAGQQQKPAPSNNKAINELLDDWEV